MAHAVAHPDPRRRPRPRLLTVALLAALLAAPLACSDDGAPVGPNPVIAGHWSGTAKGGLVRFEATFTQDGETVGGTGHFTSPIAADDFAVEGALDGADVHLILTSDELGATSFHGRFTAADRIEGTLDLPDDDLELTLERD